MPATSYPYRVFISYSHKDRAQAESLVAILKDAGLTPIWDAHLAYGGEITTQVRSSITNSHVLMPLLTPGAAKRPWVNQEIGLAVALGKPILPVAIGVDPKGILTNIKAVELRDDLSGAAAELSAESFARLMVARRAETVISEFTEDNKQRALMLADYADSVAALGHYGCVRQRASLTTFHLPAGTAQHPAWNRYFPANPPDIDLFEALRSERSALEKHARAAGCRLILDPIEVVENMYRQHGPASVRERINGLLAFLVDDTVGDVVVAINNNPDRRKSVTLVGDWFCSEAVSSAVSADRSQVFKEAVFTRNHHKVQSEIEQFDEQMNLLLAARGWDEGSSRSRAISYLGKYLEG